MWSLLRRSCTWSSRAGPKAAQHSNVEPSLDLFTKANEIEDGGGFDDFLSNPPCLILFGDNDNISLVAADDFDMAETLPSVEGIAVRQTRLAFCPTLDSLRLTGEKTIFCDIEDIYDGPPRKWTAAKDHTLATKHAFLRDCPLMGVTYYKLSGMAFLAPEVLMQQRMCKAMAKKIKEIFKIVVEERMPTLHQGIISQTDVESFRCAFLDGQS